MNQGDAAQRRKVLLTEHRLAEQGRHWWNASNLSQRLIELDPFHFEYWQMQGFAEERLGRGSMAAQCYRQALKYATRAHDVASLHLALARALKRENLKTEALAAATCATEISPNFTLAHTLRAIILSELGRWSEALLARNEVIRCAPNQATSWTSRAIHHSQCNNFALAVLDVEQAMRLQIPFGVPSLRTAIIIYIELQEYKMALKLLDQLLLQQPHDQDALFRKAKCLEWLHRTPEAIMVLADCMSFPKYKIVALQLRYELNQKQFNVSGVDRFLLAALDDAKALDTLGHPVPVATIQHIHSLQSKASICKKKRHYWCPL